MSEPSDPEVSIKEKAAPPINWSYEVFKEYLLSQARTPDFYLPLDSFPKQIELSSKWHNLLDTMRNATNKDAIERVSIVGFNISQRAILLPTEQIAQVPWQWEKNAPVARQAIELQLIVAKLNGSEGTVGILHSHPNHDKKILNFKIKTGRLSAGDLFIALVDNYGPMIGVAAGDINSFAFKARDSQPVGGTMEQFYDLWEGEPQPDNLDILIAKKYGLALYKGGVSKPLKRVA